MVRPLPTTPGFWKRQLPTKYLALAARGDLDALRELLGLHPEYLSKRGAHNRTLLWEAVRSGRLAAVRWLVEQGAELDATGCYNSESFVQITPYCAAIYYRRQAVAAYLRSQNPRLDIFRLAFLGEIDQVKHLLDAQPELLNAEDPHDFIYYVPLVTFAVVSGNLALVDSLLRRGELVTLYSTQTLGLAAAAGCFDLLELLAAYGADARAVDVGIFVATSDLYIIQYLLERGASASQPGPNGFPPLVYLARGDKGEHPEKIRLLLEHGAVVNAAGGPKGRTALHYAAAAGFLKVMALLLEHGADLTLKDDDGETALDLARRLGKSDAVELFRQREAN